MARIVSITGQRELCLSGGWRMALSTAGACATPREAADLPDWLSARVPGTVAGALRDAGRFDLDVPTSLHDQDCWWRLQMPDQGLCALRFEGLATLTEIWLDDRLVARSESMFEPVEVEADLSEGAVLWLCFRALTEALGRKLPRARWRPRMIPQQGLRGLRTTLLGQMPGWTPAVDAVGPWRPVLCVAPGPVRCRDARIAVSLDQQGVGHLSARIVLEGEGKEAPVLRCAGARAVLPRAPDGAFIGVLECPDVSPWWPHTHGNQPLYAVTLTLGDVVIDLGRTGFRRLDLDRGADGKGFSLSVNGQPVFCRGAVWTCADIVGLGGDAADYEPWLRLARDAGMNMLRISGAGAYETPAFFALCEALGILVWQDFMFANFDYPLDAPGFTDHVTAEAQAFLDAVQLSPALAVLCGGSEVHQQATMMGLRPAATASALHDQILLDAVRRYRPDVIYVANSPSDGALPFVADVGVTHYFGVGAYRRPLEDARRADVKFAGECLAFANVPQARTLERELVGATVGDRLWKSRTPSDLGADWDFEDVRDHYLARLRGVDPSALKVSDPDLYLDLSRAITGEVMAATFAEWRRGASRCGGALVWTLQDLWPGAGWGVIDASGEPKLAWYALKRSFRSLHLALTDEGCNGLAVHLANDTAEDLALDLELICLRQGATPVLRARRPVMLPGRASLEISAFDVIGAFFDITYAYRFGPPGHDVTVVRLRRAGDDRVLSEVFHYPQGAESLVEPGRVDVRLEEADGIWTLNLDTDRLVRDVQIDASGFRLGDNGFDIAPGAIKSVDLSAIGAAGGRPSGRVMAPGGKVLGSF